MKKLSDLIHEYSSFIHYFFKRIVIGLFFYSVLRILIDQELIYYEFVVKIVHAPITDFLFWLALFLALLLAYAKYIVLKSSLF